MIYGVAQQKNGGLWVWKTQFPIHSFNALIQWFRLFRVRSDVTLRVLFAGTRQELNDQLDVLNQGIEVGIVLKEFLEQHKITLFSRHAEETQIDVKRISAEKQVLTYYDQRRMQIEEGTGGDHDTPYRFALPLSMKILLVWMKLSRIVREKKLEL